MGNKVVHVIYNSEDLSVKGFWENLSITNEHSKPKYQVGQLLLKITAEKTDVKLDENFKIRLELTNVGSSPINVWKMYEQISYDIIFCYPDGSEIPYDYDIIHKNPLNDTDLVQLYPGDSIITTVNSDCGHLTEGKYKLYAVYRTMKDKDMKSPYWLGRVKSNSVGIVVY